jgi:O-acetyl-ADP-ribose deacetylase (regulator of RNase III)
MREILDRVEVVTADITTLVVDAIVNAANSSLLGGGGVDGAIHRAAGPKLLEECRSLGGCPPGEARMTGGYELPARWVIHAVGPIWRGGEQGEAAQLASAYTESLRLARRSELSAIAFPAISTGAYGFPFEPATRIAARAIGAWLVQHEWPQRVVFCCFRESDAAVYRAVLGVGSGPTA